MKPRGRAESATSRGQSETLGFVLVFSLLIIGALVVVGLGATAIGDTEKQLSDDRAEKTLTQFDSKAGLVALEESDSQRVSLPNDDGQFFVDEDAGWMAVVIENRSTGNTQEIFNSSLGAMTYENGRTTFAYQGGGVWRKTENGGQMISPPEFHYRNGTLTLPAISVTGEKSIGGTAVIKQNGTTKEFPTSSPLANKTNPLEKFEVRVVVSSDYYGGWGEYFEERTDGAVRYDEARERAILELIAPADYPPVEAGLFSGTTGTLEITNNANVTSYNSTTGDFSRTAGKVSVVGDLHVFNNAEVYGDVQVGGELVSFVSNSDPVIIDGNISHAKGTDIDSCSQSEWDQCSDKWVAQNASLGEPPVVDRLIEEQIERANKSENNDNADEDDIDESTNQLSCSGTCDLSAGTYFLDELELISKDLELNTTGDEINLVVDGDVELANDRQLNITGPERFNLYVNGTFHGTNGFKAGNFTSPNKPAPQFWMYLRTDSGATIENGAEFVGVIYGPGGIVNDGADIDIAGGSSGCDCDIYGGMLGNITSQVNNADVHFDEALTVTEPVTVESSMVKITYLHITVNEIRIED